MEYYEHLRHDGPDYSRFLQTGMKDKLNEAITDWLASGSVIIEDNVGILCDLIESAKEQKLILYTCNIYNQEDAQLLEGYALVNTMRFQTPREMDKATNYLLQFSKLLRDECIVDHCRILLREHSANKGKGYLKKIVISGDQDTHDLIIEEKYKIFVKTLDEIYNIVSNVA